MFSLLLAIIISAFLSRSSLADPGLQGSLGFDTRGAEYQQTSASQTYGYRSGLNGARMYTPEYSYFGNQHGFGRNPQDVYLPGRVNPFSYPYRRPRSSPLRTYIPDLTNVNFPQFSVYKTYETPVNPTSTYVTDRYQLFPSYETKSVFNSRNSVPLNNVSFVQGPESILNNNKTSNLSSLGNTKKISSVPGDETSVKRERDLQMSYLGYVPSLALRTDAQEVNKQSSNGSNKNVIQFYPLRIDSDSKRSVSPSPILVSPFRMGDDTLRQSFNNPQQSSFNSIKPSVSMHSTNPGIPHNSMMGFGPRPVVPPYSNNNVYPTSGTHFSQFSRGASTPIVSPFHSKTPLNMLGSPLTPNPYRYSRTPYQRTQNGYYLFDVQPLKGFNYDRYAKLKSWQPYSRAMQSNRLTAATGYNQQRFEYAKFPQETYHPQSRTFTNLDFGRLLPIYENNNGVQNSSTSGRRLILPPIGGAGWSR